LHDRLRDSLRDGGGYIHPRRCLIHSVTSVFKELPCAVPFLLQIPNVRRKKAALRLLESLGNLSMKKFFIAICLLSTVFDAASIILGLCVAAKINTIPGYVFCGVGGLGILALMLSTHDAWYHEDIFHRCLRIFWWLAILMNVLMVFLASYVHVILRNALSDSVNYDLHKVFSADLIQLSTIVVLTIFLTASPIGLSFLWGTFFEDAGELGDRLKPGNRKAAPAPN
jgi:hypothetical protein